MVIVIIPVLVKQSGCVITNVGFAGGINAGFTIAEVATLKQPVFGSLCVIEYVALAGILLKTPVVLLNNPVLIK